MSDPRKSRIPSSYQPAEWRGTTPLDTATNEIGVGFDLIDGTTVRIALSSGSAKHLAETIYDSLAFTQPQDPSVAVSVDLLRLVEHALVSLKQYIDQAPPDNPLVWIADRVTPVRQLPDYGYAEEAICQVKNHIRSQEAA